MKTNQSGSFWDGHSADIRLAFGCTASDKTWQWQIPFRRTQEGCNGVFDKKPLANGGGPQKVICSLHFRPKPIFRGVVVGCTRWNFQQQQDFYSPSPLDEYFQGGGGGFWNLAPYGGECSGHCRPKVRRRFAFPSARSALISSMSWFARVFPKLPEIFPEFFTKL